MDEPVYIFGPVTSFLVWRAAMQGLVDEPYDPTCQPNLAHSHATLRMIRELPMLRSLGDVPIDAIVGQPSRTHECKSIDTIVLKGQLPSGSFKQVGRHAYVCSPELCFALLARGGFDRHLLEVGCELCGTYCLAPNQSGEFFEVSQLLTLDKLQSFLEQLGRRHGIRVARQAASLLQEGSASPRETSLYIVLTIYPRYGGYGLPKPKLNGRLDISPHSQLALRKGYLKVDLLYTDSQGNAIAVGEYDSASYHFYTKQAQASGVFIDVCKVIADDLRREIIRDEDVDIVTFRKEDTEHFDDFDMKAMRLARLVGAKPLASEGSVRNERIDLFTNIFDTKRWTDEHQLLRKMAGYERVIEHPSARKRPSAVGGCGA